MIDYNLQEIESSQRQHHETLRHSEVMASVINEAQYKLFSMLNPKLYKDGNQWCVLYGENIQDGICGFGETPFKAILEWNQNWHSKILKQ